MLLQKPGFPEVLYEFQGLRVLFLPEIMCILQSHFFFLVSIFCKTIKKVVRSRFVGCFVFIYGI